MIAALAVCGTRAGIQRDAVVATEAEVLDAHRDRVFRREGFLVCSIADELDPPEQTFTPDVSDVRVMPKPSRQFLVEKRTLGLHMRDNVLLPKDLLHLEGSRTCNGMALEGVAVDECACAVV